MIKTKVAFLEGRFLSIQSEQSEKQAYYQLSKTPDQQPGTELQSQLRCKKKELAQKHEKERL